MKPAIESLPILVLDVHSRCNCRCVMCDIWKRDTVREIHPDDLLKQLPAIERLGVQWVVLTGGEPLMHSDLFALCAPLKLRRIRITLLTTGLLLDRFAEQIVRNINDVIVSLDGPPEIHNRIRRVSNAFERLSSGIRALRSHNPRFPVSARSVVQRGNCHCLVATAQAARGLSCDSISFLAGDTHSAAFDHTPENVAEPRAPAVVSEIIPTLQDIDKLSDQVDCLVASGQCGAFVAESPEKLKRIVDHARWSHGIGHPAAPRCNAPWVSAVLQPDGAVRPCFFHPPIGNVASGATLDSALNSFEAVRFRASLDVATNPVCRQCVCALNWKG